MDGINGEKRPDVAMDSIEDLPSSGFKMSKVRIVSNGLAYGTKVYLDGVELTNVRALTISPLDCENKLVTVTLELMNVELDVTGELIETTPFNSQGRVKTYAHGRRV
jgi:hypothetical protein